MIARHVVKLQLLFGASIYENPHEREVTPWSCEPPEPSQPFLVVRSVKETSSCILCPRAKPGRHLITSNTEAWLPVQSTIPTAKRHVATQKRMEIAESLNSLVKAELKIYAGHALTAIGKNVQGRNVLNYFEHYNIGGS